MTNTTALYERAVHELQVVGFDMAEDGGLTFSDYDDDTPFVTALMNSGLVAAGMTGLDLRDVQLSRADVSVIARASRALHQCDAWLRGDLMVWLKENRYGGGDIPRKELLAFSDELGCHWKRALNNLTTAKAWPVEERFASSSLSYSHHEILAPLQGDARDAWATRCITEGITAGQLRKLLQEDNLVVKQLYDEDGNEIETVASFASESFDPAVAIGKMWTWYENELNKKVSPKQAFENVMHTFRAAGMVVLPPKHWMKGSVPAQTGEEESEE